MKRTFFSCFWVVGALTISMFCLPACQRELDVQQSYPFRFETLPVQKNIAGGETAEIRCHLIPEGRFIGTRYTLRYFQPDGKGELRLDDGRILHPNDRYPLSTEVFRLYYTSQSKMRQTINLYIEDSFGHLVQKTFDFNHKKEDYPKPVPQPRPSDNDDDDRHHPDRDPNPRGY